MKKIITGIAVILLIALAFTACKKDNNISSKAKHNNQSIYVQNERMIFENTDVFYQHLSWIFKNQDNPQLIEQFNNNLGLKSMMSIYNTGINMENESDFISYYKKYPNAFYTVKLDSSIFYELPASIGLAYLSNKNGIFQVRNNAVESI